MATRNRSTDSTVAPTLSAALLGSCTVVSKYTYTTEIASAEALGPDHYVVTGRLTGNFPGGTADLNWDFTIAGQHITRLIIAR